MADEPSKPGDPLAEHPLSDVSRRLKRPASNLPLFPDVGQAPLDGSAGDDRSVSDKTLRHIPTSPLPSKREESGELLEPSLDPVTFVRRLTAGLADVLIIGLVGAVELTAGALLLELRFPPAAFVGVFSFLFLAALVLLVLTPFVWGTTPGMALADLRIVAKDGGSPTLGASFLRFVGFVLTGALAGVPLLIAAFDRQGRSLADLLSGTTVSAALRRPAP